MASLWSLQIGKATKIAENVLRNTKPKNANFLARALRALAWHRWNLRVGKATKSPKMYCGIQAKER